MIEESEVLNLKAIYETRPTVWGSIQEAHERYRLSAPKIKEIATKANAITKIGRIYRINFDLLDEALMKGEQKNDK